MDASWKIANGKVVLLVLFIALNFVILRSITHPPVIAPDSNLDDDIPYHSDNILSATRLPTAIYALVSSCDAVIYANRYALYLFQVVRIRHFSHKGSSV
jgi:hypothetical protein